MKIMFSKSQTMKIHLFEVTNCEQSCFLGHKQYQIMKSMFTRSQTMKIHVFKVTSYGTCFLGHKL